MRQMDDLSEKTLSSKKIYEGKIINVRLDRVHLPDGKEGCREVVELGGAVAIVPLCDEEVYFVRQYRTPVEKILLEIPAGRLEPGEEPEECAQRELAEEIGFGSSRLHQLAFFYSSPGFSNETLYLYLAQGLIYRPVPKEEGEFLQVESMPFSKALEKVYRGEIRDGKTIAGLLMTWHYLKAASNK